tara:strand:- start:233 stop:466 length:234 start_codon:yes stop_codon:yes gene_type:complete
VRKENQKTTLRKSILARFVELLVQNGHYIEHLLGKPLNSFNYINMVETLADDTLNCCLEKWEADEYKAKLQLLNLLT